MTHFPTCIGCRHKPDCEHLKSVKTRISGLFVTTLKHRCKFREPTFKAGDPVLIRTRVCSNESLEGEEPQVAIFPGHFIEQYGTKAITFIAPGTLSKCEHDPWPFEPFSNGRGFVKVPLARIEPDQSREPVRIQHCAGCGQRVTFVDECYCASVKDYAA